MVRAQQPGHDHGQQANGPRPGDDDGLAALDAADAADAVQRCGRGGDERCLVQGHVVRDLVHRVGVIAGILGVAAVGTKAIVAVPLGLIAIVQAGGIPPISAVGAYAAALVRLDGHPVADGELGHAGAQGHNLAGVLVAKDEPAGLAGDAVGRMIRPAVGQDLGVGAADGAGPDPDQYLARLGLGHGIVVHQPHVAFAVQDGRLHGFWQ
jgi:hypothetical protein